MQSTNKSSMLKINLIMGDLRMPVWIKNPYLNMFFSKLLNMRSVNFGLIVVLLLVPFFAYGDCKGCKLYWEDDFNGVGIDKNNWEIFEGKRGDSIASKDAIEVIDGKLLVMVISKDYVKTGFLVSNNKDWPLKGYAEAKILFKGGKGSWCAFWMQPENYGKVIGRPDLSGGEIDIAEYRLMDSEGNNLFDKVVGNIHWDGYGVFHKTSGYEHQEKNGFEGKWNVFGLKWTDKNYVFYVNEKKVWEFDRFGGVNKTDIRLTCEVLDGAWAGVLDKDAYDDRALVKKGMEVDWVRVWSID